MTINRLLQIFGLHLVIRMRKLHYKRDNLFTRLQEMKCRELQIIHPILQLIDVALAQRADVKNGVIGLYAFFPTNTHSGGRDCFCAHSMYVQQ